MSWLLIPLLIIILILFNSLYVAAEFSAVSSRKSRLSALVEEGNSAAGQLMAIVDDPQKLDHYVAACQLGITITSLVLGAYGQDQLAPILAPTLERTFGVTAITAQSISITIIIITLTTLQVLFGELVPKNIGIQYPESLGMATLLPMKWSKTIFRPLIWFFNGSGQLIMRLFGRDVIAEHAHYHSPQEIVMLVEESSAGGLLKREERRLLKNTLELREMMVRQVMIPRTSILHASVDLSCDELFILLADSPYSRLPLYKKNIDDIVGVIHLKDLLCLRQQNREVSPTDILRPIPLVPETMQVRTAFSLLQRQHLRVAIVLDEFGGTAGMVTIEDLIEEIFGELQDEFDTHIPAVRILGGDRLWIRGDTLVEDLNEWLEFQLPVESLDTIGGLVLNVSGHVPKLGEEIQIEEIGFRIEKMRGRGVSALSIPVSEGQIHRLRERIT